MRCIGGMARWNVLPLLVVVWTLNVSALGGDRRRTRARSDLLRSAHTNSQPQPEPIGREEGENVCMGGIISRTVS